MKDEKFIYYTINNKYGIYKNRWKATRIACEKNKQERK